MDDDDRALIDKVANATHFDLLPIEDRFAWGGLFIPHGRRHAGFVALISRLAELGVMNEPAGDELIADVFKHARAAAKRWIETNGRSEGRGGARG